MKKTWDALWINAMLVTCEGSYGLIEDGALAINDGKIAWVGEMAHLNASARKSTRDVYNAAGFCITPGFIDCHTHIVYAGNRAHEFALRLQGLSYEEIARLGGGIFSTVSVTRNASEDELLRESLKRARTLQKSGVTSLEIKSGYGLDWDSECKLLRVADEISKRLSLTVIKTFLGAHAIPIEYRDNRKGYVDLICEKMIPEIAQQKLANAIDVFSENIAFNLKETEQIFKAAKQFGLPIKCHAEQLSNSGSAMLAAKYAAISVDHLEHLSERGVKELALSGKTVAVLLPGAFYFLREKKRPPIDLLKKYRVPIAIASDCNPGTSPIVSLRIILNMACVLFDLTPEEALLAVTQNAARALNIENDYGSLTVGKVADFVVWDVSHPRELAYYIGDDPLHQLIKNGNIILNNTTE